MNSSLFSYREILFVVAAHDVNLIKNSGETSHIFLYGQAQLVHSYSPLFFPTRWARHDDDDEKHFIYFHFSDSLPKNASLWSHTDISGAWVENLVIAYWLNVTTEKTVKQRRSGDWEDLIRLKTTVSVTEKHFSDFSNSQKRFNTLHLSWNGLPIHLNPHYRWN